MARVRGGFTYTWLGLEVSRANWTFSLSERRAQWLLGWLSRAFNAEEVDLTDLRGALGRMSWAYGALLYDKPFLGGLFRFLAATHTHTRIVLPTFAKLIMLWLRDRLRARRSMACPIRPSFVRSSPSCGREGRRHDGGHRGVAARPQL